MTTEERFWSKVDKGRDCWEWTGTRNNKMRGCITVRGRTVLAHRLSYEINVGPIPDGLCVCHHCDNPLCVRPDHLFVGTHKENTHDAMKKGRLIPPPLRRPGHRYEAKTTFADRVAMHELHSQGVPMREIGRRFGVANGAVRYHLRAFTVPSS